MFKYVFVGCALFSLTAAKAEENNASKTLPARQQKEFKSFSGKVVGSHVRLRTAPELESSIVGEYNKGDLFVVVGEKNDFYKVAPPTNSKAYIFRSFVLDNIVEGNRVNVRLEPSLEAPVVGHVNSGTRVDGKICERNGKWLEIAPPENTVFYIAKEFVEYAGGPEYKAVQDKRYATMKQLMDSAALLTQSEMHKSFEEINIARIKNTYLTVINDYVDFPGAVEKAKNLLNELEKDYQNRQIAYLKAKNDNLSNKFSHDAIASAKQNDVSMQNACPERTKVWEKVEEAIFISWSAMHHAKTMDDYYTDQKLNAKFISGVLELFSDPVGNKPGSHILKENGIPVGCVYSTHINLENLIGKRVNLQVSERPNNNFAFPAYYVLDSE
ncbi:MAG: SH3 domain-containing protein [Candidatus Algichlamydia australiensis]|nr:SH3 domain-containing protein [Chlamydiales bacterium]